MQSVSESLCGLQLKRAAFQCSKQDCGRRFSVASNLKRHEKVGVQGDTLRVPLQVHPCDPSPHSCLALHGLIVASFEARTTDLKPLLTLVDARVTHLPPAPNPGAPNPGDARHESFGNPTPVHKPQPFPTAICAGELRLSPICASPVLHLLYRRTLPRILGPDPFAGVLDYHFYRIVSGQWVGPCAVSDMSEKAAGDAGNADEGSGWDRGTRESHGGEERECDHELRRRWSGNQRP